MQAPERADVLEPTGKKIRKKQKEETPEEENKHRTKERSGRKWSAIQTKCLSNPMQNFMATICRMQNWQSFCKGSCKVYDASSSGGDDKVPS